MDMQASAGRFIESELYPGREDQVIERPEPLFYQAHPAADLRKEPYTKGSGRCQY